MSTIYPVYDRAGHLVTVDRASWFDHSAQRELASRIGGRVFAAVVRNDWFWVPPVARFVPLAEKTQTA